MSQPRVVISGLGFITSIGNSHKCVSESLRFMRSGIESIEFITGVKLPITLAGTIKGFDTHAATWAGWVWPDGYNFSRDSLRTMPPHGLYALCATEQMVADAKLSPAELASDETALFCSSGGSPKLLRQYLNQIIDSNGQRVSPASIVSTIAGTLNFNLSAHYHIRGAVAGFSSACASTTQALGYGFDEIRLGRHKRVIVVGGEEVGLEATYGFHGMRALSRQSDPLQASRPFDKKRDGFVATGGSVALVLEDIESASKRGAPIYAEVLGWGQAGDGHNPAISDPEGLGLATAMKRALNAAQLEPGLIDYVNAHATSTPAGDASEAKALKSVFTSSGANPKISSTKALTGHGLSMSGVMETAFCALALKEAFMPASANITELDPVCEGLRIIQSTQNIAARYILKNSSGFGGSNVSLVLGKAEF